MSSDNDLFPCVAGCNLCRNSHSCGGTQPGLWSVPVGEHFIPGDLVCHSTNS